MSATVKTPEVAKAPATLRHLSDLLQHQISATSGATLSLADEQWLLNLTQTVSYAQSNDGLAGLWAHEQKLMKWVQNQRIAYRGGWLGQARRELLNTYLPGWIQDHRSRDGEYVTAVAAWFHEHPAATELPDRATTRVDGELVPVGRRTTYRRARARAGFAALDPQQVRASA